MAVTQPMVEEALAAADLAATAVAARPLLAAALTPLFNLGGGGGGGAVTKIIGSAAILVNPSTGIGDVTLTHAASGVTTGTYGDSSHYPVVTVDANGHLTVASVQALPAAPVGSSAVPLMDGVGAAGTSAAWAHGDHVHPTDTSRQAASTDLAALSGFGAAGGYAKRLGAGSWSVVASIPQADVTGLSAALATIPSLSSATPQPLGTAAAGTSSAGARGDHVHAMPTASQVGAEPALGNPGSNGQALVSTTLGVRSWASVLSTVTSDSASRSANTVYAAPNGSAGAATFRALVWPDISAILSASGALSISSGAIFHSAADGYHHVPATGTTSSGKLLIPGSTAGSEAWVAMSGDATISSAGALTLASVATAGSAGSASVVPVVTWDAKGRVTSVSTATITPGAIGAVSAAGGTYSSVYTVTKLITSLLTVSSLGSGFVKSDASGNISYNSLTDTDVTGALGYTPAPSVSGGYLPLSAGSSKALTNELYGTAARFANGTGSVQIAPYSSSTAGWMGYTGWNTGASTGAGFWAWSDGGVGVDVATGRSFTGRVAGVGVFGFSGSGVSAYQPFSGTSATFSGSVTTGQHVAASSGGGGSAAVLRAQANSGNAGIAWYTADGSTDGKWWDALATGATLSFRAVNDTNSAASTWLQVTRSASSISSVALPPLFAGGIVRAASSTGVLSASALSASDIPSTLNATTFSGPVTFPNGIIRDKVGASGNGVIYGSSLSGGPSSTNMSLQWAADGSAVWLNASSNVYLSIGFSNILTGSTNSLNIANNVVLQLGNVIDASGTITISLTSPNNYTLTNTGTSVITFPSPSSSYLGRRYFFTTLGRLQFTSSSTFKYRDTSIGTWTSAGGAPPTWLAPAGAIAAIAWCDATYWYVALV